jgi:hypothetical protein
LVEKSVDQWVALKVAYSAAWSGSRLVEQWEPLLAVSTVVMTAGLTAGEWVEPREWKSVA